MFIIGWILIVIGIAMLRGLIRSALALNGKEASEQYYLRTGIVLFATIAVLIVGIKLI